MPKIVDIFMRRGRPERFIIKLEEKQELIFTPEIVAKFGISPNREFSDKQFLQILEENSLQQAKDQAMRYLTVRPHSRLELVRKMRGKGFHFEVINRSLDHLEKIDLLNDNQYARLFIQNELRLRPVSRALLLYKLLQRGIKRETSETLLKELMPVKLEIEIAHSLAEKYQRTHSHWQVGKLREKLVQYLKSKGFLWEHIRQVIPPANSDEI